MVVASTFILPGLQVSEFREAEKAHPEYATMLPSEVDGLITETMEKHAEDQPEARQEMVAHDLNVVKTPYVVIAMVVLAMLVVFAVSKLPDTGREEDEIELMATVEAPVYQLAIRRRRDRPNVLRWCSDHVLDVHHSLRDDAGWTQRGTGTELQHHCDGDFSGQSLHLHVHLEIPFARFAAGNPGCWWCLLTAARSSSKECRACIA